MKYIDAERLIAKVQPYYEDAKCNARYAAETGTSSDCAKWDKAKAIYEYILHIITSLQQEQAKGIDGVVHHTLNNHWIATDEKQLTTVLKGFPEGTEVKIFICAKKED